MAKIQSKKTHIRQGIHDFTQKNMITKWMLQEEIPLPATSPWHEVPEGVHENVVFPVPIIRLSSLPRKARRMRWSTVALASTIILQEPTQAGETYPKLVAYMMNKVRKISE